MSHARSAAWLAASDLTMQGADHAAGGSILRVATKLGATQRDTTVVQNRVEFADGFSRPHRQAFQVHVAYPTESLTLLVKFPEGEPFRTLNGSWRRPGGPFVPGVEKPLGIASGSVAYWRSECPPPGETYQLSWT